MKLLQPKPQPRSQLVPSMGGSPGCPLPYLLPGSPPRRAASTAGTISRGCGLVPRPQPLAPSPAQHQAEQGGQLPVGPQVLRLEVLPAERAGGAPPPPAVGVDAGPAEAVAAARQPHGLGEVLQAAGAAQLHVCQQPTQLLRDSHGPARGGAERGAVSFPRGAASLRGGRARCGAGLGAVPGPVRG